MVLGIDPGTSRTGYGIVRVERSGLALVDAGVLRSPSGPVLGQRIRRLCDQMEALLERHGPAMAAMEGVFTARNVRSSLTMAHVRGAFLLTLARRELAVAEYAPGEVKRAVTGHGNADKEQVRHMVRFLVGRRDLTLPLDATDALAVAICHAHTASGRLRVSR